MSDGPIKSVAGADGERDAAFVNAELTRLGLAGMDRNRQVFELVFLANRYQRRYDHLSLMLKRNAENSYERIGELEQRLAFFGPLNWLHYGWRRLQIALGHA